MKNNKLFWPMCFMTNVLGIVWSLLYYLKGQRVLHAVFFILNIVLFIITLVCFILNKEKNNRDD